MSKYIKMIDGKFEGWRGYLTGRVTKIGKPIVTLYSNAGDRISKVAVNVQEYIYIKKYDEN